MTLNKTRYRPSAATLLRFRGVGTYTLFAMEMLQNLDCGTNIIALADASVPVQCRRQERGIRQRQHPDLGRQQWQDEGVEHRDGRRDDGGAGWLQVRAVETRERQTQTAGRALRVHGGGRPAADPPATGGGRREGGRAQADRLLPGAFADRCARLPRRGDCPRLPERRGAAAAGGGAADVSVRTS
jgi:hypothetical protein